MHHEEISVTVQYVGKADFRDTVPGRKDLQAIKVQAMRSFELDVSQASKYVLQLNGADLPDHTKAGDLGTQELMLTLRLKEEVAKG